MLWENLTAADFEKAVRETGVCLLPIGVLEKHADHLPLGEDMFEAHEFCRRAAEKEPAVVFPAWFLAQCNAARAFPGCVTIKPTLVIELLQAICDEIGRNGFKNILIVNAHGGNRYLLPFLAQCSLGESKSYSIYVDGKISPEPSDEWAAALKSPNHAHACECETSIALAIHPELVKMKAIPKAGSEPLGRQSHLKGLYTGTQWYSDYPDQYGGDARPASIETGRKLVKLGVDWLAKLIAAVKADKVVPALEAEFAKRAADPCGVKGGKRPTRRSNPRGR